MMHKNTLKTIVGASVLTVLVLGWMQPAVAQDPNCMWGQGDVLCRSNRAAADITNWLQGDIERQAREREQGQRRPWYASPTMPAQEQLLRELKGMGLLKPGWNDRPASVEIGEAVVNSLRRMDALGPACRRGNAPACAELRQIQELEARRSREIQRAIGVMAAENERLERSNQLRRSELAQRYRTQAIELRGLADRYDIIAEQSFRNDDFAAGRYFREQAAMLRQQAEQLTAR